MPNRTSEVKVEVVLLGMIQKGSYRNCLHYNKIVLKISIHYQLTVTLRRVF